MPGTSLAVSLRPLRAPDADVLARWAADPQFCRAAEWANRPLEEHRAVLRHRIQSPPGDLLRLGAIQSDDLVGYVDLHGSEPSRRELGYLIGPRERWGRGLGLAVAAAGLRYGFEELALTTIWAEVADANAASVRILQRLGMTEIERGDDVTYLGVPTFYRRFTLERDT